jgi:hypothetical protein
MNREGGGNQRRKLKKRIKGGNCTLVVRGRIWEKKGILPGDPGASVVFRRRMGEEREPEIAGGGLCCGPFLSRS